MARLFYDHPAAGPAGSFGRDDAGFCPSLGEFGATIMVAGNIPGQTTTLSVAIYQFVQIGEDAHAWVLAGVSAVLAFLAIWGSELLLRGKRALRQ